MAKPIVEIPDKGPGGFELISRIKGTGTSGTFSVALTKSYNFIIVRSFIAGNGVALTYYLRLNGESGTGVYWHRGHFNQGTTNTVFGEAAVNGIYLGGVGTTSAYPAASEVFLGCRNTGGNRVAFYEGSFGSGTSTYARQAYTAWYNTASPLTSLVLWPSASTTIQYDFSILGR